jgi:hypothetical protein
LTRERDPIARPRQLALGAVVPAMPAHSGVYRLRVLCACSAVAILANAVLLPAQNL